MATILVVDDDKKLLKMMRRTLIYEGFQVATALNGREALARQPPSNSTNNYSQTYTQIRNLNGEIIQSPANLENVRHALK